jgi:hypothetical protein
MSRAARPQDSDRMAYPGDLAIAYRALTDAWLEGTALYWRGRAVQLEAARPRRGDFTGHASAAEVRARWDRLTEAAAACRTRAALADVARAEFLDTLTDVASGAAA